jgi:phage terminase small subunit
MGKTGRNAFVATDLVRYGEPGRLAPPASLGEAERKAFLDLVCSVPVTQFAPCDLPLLCRWAETVALAERMATRMVVEGEITEQGKVNPAVAVHREAVKTLNALALRLRVSPQSRAQKAPRREMREVSYYERLDLELAADDGRDDDDARDQRG